MGANLVCLDRKHRELIDAAASTAAAAMKSFAVNQVQMFGAMVHVIVERRECRGDFPAAQPVRFVSESILEVYSPFAPAASTRDERTL